MADPLDLIRKFGGEPRDLTPEEARAEVEAFMGEGWVVDAHAANDPCSGGVRAWLHSPSGALVGLHSDATTLRAAVDALKQAWRDAVRPWVDEAMDAGALLDRDEANHKSSIERRDAAYAEELARLLKEDSK